MIFGVTSTGFNAKRLSDCKTEIESVFRQTFGAGIKLTPDTIFGKLVGIMAERETELWEGAEAEYNSHYPNSASDISLDGIGEYTAFSRNAAAVSTAIAYLAGTNTTLIPTGTLFAVQDSGDQFITLANVNLAGSQFAITSLTLSGSTVTAVAAAHGRSVGQYVFINDAVETEYNGLVEILTVADANTFTYAITTTPTSPATGIITADPATAVNVESVDTGPIAALAGTLNQIVNTISGLDRVDNYADATKGVNIETDAEFRTRRLEALQGLGAARLEAIRGALLQINNVTAAKVFENVDIVPDVDGRPAKSIECLVIGGLDSDILSVVWDKKAAGIEVFGSISGTVTDSQGIDHTSRFNRPVASNIYLEIDFTVDVDFPGTAEVLSRLLTFGAALEIGEDVVVYPYLISSFNDVPGILDLAIRIGTAASPTLDDNIVIPDTQIADFDSSRITLAVL